MKTPGKPVPATTGTTLDDLSICHCGSLGDAFNSAVVEMQQHTDLHCMSTYAAIVMAHGFILGHMLQQVPGLLEQVKALELTYNELSPAEMLKLAEIVHASAAKQQPTN